MNKVDLIEGLKDESGLSRTKPKQVVEMFFDEITEVPAIKKGRIWQSCI